MSLAIAVHGPAGVGKTTLGMTAPGPRLHIDTEGGGEWLAGKLVRWTDLGALPAGIDEDTTVTISVSGDNAIMIFQSIYQWLLSGKHPFNSVILDSLTEMQKRMIDKSTPIGGGDPDWILIQRLMEKLIRELNDLKNHPTHPLQTVMFITGTHQKMNDKVAGPHSPALSGQLSDRLPHFVDVCGYASLVVDKDNNVTTYLQILPGNNTVAKDRTSPPGRSGLSTAYGHTITNPNIQEMLAVLNQQQVVA